jgi:hypothetical protein
MKMRQEVKTSLSTLMGNWTKGQRHGRIAGYLGRPQTHQWYNRLKRGLTLYEGQGLSAVGKMTKLMISRNMTTHFLQVLQ